MRCIEVNDEEQRAGVAGQESVPGSTSRKWQCARTAWLPIAFFISAAFIFGTVCGFVKLKANRQAGSRCHLEENNGITSELEAGLNVVMEWFPEEARQMRENRKDIIDHIASFTEPPLNSPLRKLSLIREDFPEEVSSTFSQVRARRLSSSCSGAVARFALQVLIFVASSATFPIPEEQAFYATLHSYFLEKSTPAEVQQLAQHANELSSAEDTEHKALVIRMIMQDALTVGRGWLKFLSRLTARTLKHLADPWEIVRKLVAFAAQLKLWIQGNSIEYNALVALRILGAEKMIAAAVRAMGACRPRLSATKHPGNVAT